MNLLALKDKRQILFEELKVLASTAKKEFRKLTTDEDNNLNDKITGINALDIEIKSVEEADKKETTKVEIKEIRKEKMDNFNLLKAIRNAANNLPKDDATMAIINAGMEDFRRAGISPKGGITLPMELRTQIQAAGSVDTTGGYIVAVDKWNLLEPLRASLVAVQAGANLMTGLVGDISLPVYAGTTVAWKNEVSASADGGGAFSEVTLTPKKLCAYLDVSSQFLTQDSVGAQNLLMNDMIHAIRVKLEAAMFAETTAADTPTTLFGTLNDISGSISGSNWTKIVKFENKVDTNNALVGNLAYVTSPTGRFTLKTTGQATTYDVNKIMAADGTVMGYPCFVTSNVVDTFGASNDEAGVLFGNFADLIIGQWGGLDILVDPYSQAIYGNVRLVINSYWDFTKRRSTSFSAGSIKA